MTNEELLCHLGKVARSESSVVPPSTKGSVVRALGRDDPDLQAFMAPLSEEATDRILANVARSRGSAPPRQVLVNSRGLGTDRSAQDAETSTAGAWNRTGITRLPSFWSRVVNGPALPLLQAVPMLAGATPALLSAWFPDPFPRVEVQAVLRDETPLEKEKPIRLALERSDNTVHFKLALAEPYADAIDAKAFLEDEHTYFLLASRTAPGGAGEVSVDTGLSGLTNVPEGPARLVIFVGRPGHLPSTPDEAKPARLPGAAESRHYRVVVRDVVVGGEGAQR